MPFIFSTVCKGVSSLRARLSPAIHLTGLSRCILILLCIPATHSLHVANPMLGRYAAGWSNASPPAAVSKYCHPQLAFAPFDASLSSRKQALSIWLCGSKSYS